jgi:hypothetical protein
VRARFFLDKRPTSAGQYQKLHVALPPWRSGRCDKAKNAKNSCSERDLTMSMVMIQNPNDKGVKVKVVGKGWFLGLGAVSEEVNVGPSSVGSVEVLKGKYHIRYKFSDDSSVWEGDPFQLDAESAAQITLQAMAGGNYGIKRSSGGL